GGAAPAASRARGAVPPGVGADRRRAPHSAQFPGDGAVVFAALIEKLVRLEDLTADEAAAAMREVMEGRAAAASLAALLSALVMKGERPAEIVGFARTMREHAVPLSAPAGPVFDTCGTGGDRS